MSGFEVRATQWYNVTNRPEWDDSKVAAYRILVARYGLLWYQRHEWSFLHRNSIDQDPWISSIRGFGDHLEPVFYPLVRFLREVGEGRIFDDT